MKLNVLVPEEGVVVVVVVEGVPNVLLPEAGVVVVEGVPNVLLPEVGVEKFLLP